MDTYLTALVVGLGLVELLVLLMLLAIVAGIVLLVVKLSLRGGTHLEKAMRGKPAGWYADPVAPGSITFWTGRKWEWATRQPAPPEGT